MNGWREDAQWQCLCVARLHIRFINMWNLNKCQFQCSTEFIIFQQCFVLAIFFFSIFLFQGSCSVLQLPDIESFFFFRLFLSLSPFASEWICWFCSERQLFAGKKNVLKENGSCWQSRRKKKQTEAKWKISAKLASNHRRKTRRQHAPWGTFQTQMYITISSISVLLCSSPSDACHYVASFFFCLHSLLFRRHLHPYVVAVHTSLLPHFHSVVAVMLSCLRFNFA